MLEKADWYKLEEHGILELESLYLNSECSSNYLCHDFGQLNNLYEMIISISQDVYKNSLK